MGSYLWNVFDERNGKFDVGEEVQIHEPRDGVCQRHNQRDYEEQPHDAKKNAANFWRLLTTGLAAESYNNASVLHQTRHIWMPIIQSR